MGRIAFPGQLRQKIFVSSQQKKADMVAHACQPCDAGCLKEKIMVQASLAKKRPYLQNNQSKKVWIKW
jgi:hypothetical protein